jgi:hypothetical protein
MSGLRGQGGVSCCAEHDCAETTVALLGAQGGTAEVLVGDTVLSLPAAAVHPSQDGRGYWCFKVQIPADGTRSHLYTDSHGQQRAVPPDVPTRENTRCIFHSASG